MKTVWIIGGGVSRDNIANTLFLKNHKNFLKNTNRNPYQESTKGWKDTLESQLGNDYKTIKFPMDKTLGADYDEWRIIFDQYIQKYQSKDDTLIGHSLGGSFLLKYLSEFPNAYIGKRIFLIAPALIHEESERIGSFFYEHLENYGPKNLTTLFFSKDDPLISKNHILYAKDIFPSSQIQILENRGHFLDEQFPELVKAIKK